MIIAVLVVAVVLLFTIVIGIVLMNKGNSKLDNEKLTDDVSILLDENLMDEEII